MLLTCPSSGRPLGNWVTKVEDASLLGPVPVLLIFIVLFSFRQKSMDSTAFEATQGGLQLQQEGSNAGRFAATNNHEIEKAVLDSPTDGNSLKPASDSTHRRLKSRHIQLIGIGGTIGTALFVQIGQPLIQGGPGSLFIAFTLW